MSQSKVTVKHLKEAGQEQIAKALAEGKLLSPKEALEDREMRGFWFGDAKKRDNLLINMLLRVEPKLAIEIIDRKDIREDIGPGSVLFAQFAVEASPDAAWKALQRREVYLLPATSSSRQIKYIAHSAVFHANAARFALDCDDLCDLENKNGGTLFDYIKKIHKDSRIFIKQPDPHESAYTKNRTGGEMVWGKNGKHHY